MHNVVKLCLVGVALVHADKQTDGLKEGTTEGQM